MIRNGVKSHSQLWRSLFVVTIILGTTACIFLFVRFQAHGATVERPGAASSNVQIFAFPARSGKSTFNVVSLPETDYAGDVQKGSSIFAAWDGNSTAANYMNFAHTKQNSDTSDNFLMQFFNQNQCIVNPSGKSVPGNMLSEKFTATFVKPNITPASQSQTHKTIRAYDHFEVVWGNGRFTVTITRYWRSIKLPDGVSASSFSPNDYFIEQPLPSDVPSPTPVTKTLTYSGDFAPFATRITHGEPYDVDTFARPASVLIDDVKNKDFNYFDISTEANGENTSPSEVSCVLNADTTVAEKVEPCGCLNNNNIKACSDKTIPYVDLWPPVQFSFATGSQWAVKDINELQDALASYGEQFNNDGSVRLDVNTYGATNNNEYNLAAMILGFKTKSKDAYFSWCFNGKSQQGLVAGGEWIEETQASIATKDADSSGCCDLVTRTPEVDANNDGLDDVWQKKYGYILTGQEGYLLPANYDSDSSGSKATTGLPGDGYVADEFLDTNGQRIAVAPGSINARTKEKYVTGDGKFSAGEEYIWGTNPLQYDTDQDGFPDEADVVGVGQSKVDFVSNLQPRQFPGPQDAFGNDRYNVKVKVLGRIDQLRTQEDADSSGSAFPNVTRIAEQTRDIFAQDPGEMTVALASEPESPGIYDKLTVQASLVMGDRAGGNPIFFWYAKRIPGVKNNPGTGQPNGKTPFLQGEGIYKFEKTIHDICPDCQPGDELEITVDVSDVVRGSVATDVTTIAVGGTNSLQIFQDCNQDGTDDEVGSSTYCFGSNGVTKDIPVRVSASFLDLDPSQYYFQWRLNNVVQTSNCLPANATSATTPVRCSFGTSQMVFTPHDSQTEYPIELLVYRNDRADIPPSQFNPTPSAQVARLESTIQSGIPAVTIVFEPTSTRQDGGYQVGSTITARAKVDFLDPQPKRQLVADTSIPGTTGGTKALRYVWRNSSHQIIKVDEIPSIDGSTITLTSKDPSLAEIYVEVTSPDFVSKTNEDVHVVLNGKGLAYFVNGNSATSFVARLQVRLASVLSLVPRPLVQVLRVLSVLAFSGIIVVFFVSIPKRSQKK